MDQELKENLPLFSVLVLGGALILLLSGVILYQQYRGVGNEIAIMEERVPERSSTNTQTNSGKDMKMEVQEVSIMGAWQDPDPKDGDRAYIFQSNGLYTEQYFHKGSIWPKARGTFSYYPKTRFLTFIQTDSYEFATFGPPIPDGAEISVEVSKLTDTELCLKGMTEVCMVRLGANIPTSPSNDPSFTERMPNPIAGTWETGHQVASGEGAEFWGGEGAELYGKWVFNADGTFQHSLVNTSRPPIEPMIEGKYRVGTYKVSSGNKIDVIGFTEFRAGETDFRDQIGKEQAEFVVINNLRIDSANRICLYGGDIWTDEPSKLREDQWQCLDRK
ncbi:hypothetical protein IT407_03535 [Candidatus Uhrbacteria bacterium]|nr:hypothetical protein [Candidatus Uhrbacteria bacterium]